MKLLFSGRIWPFSSEAAHWYAEVLRRRERLTQPMATADAVIAATALANGAPLATRDVDDFAGIGLTPDREQRLPSPPRSAATLSSNLHERPA